MDKITEMRILVSELNAASDAYYNGKEILMSDAEFDLTLKHLEKLEKELYTVLANSPTVNVGAPVLNTLEKVKHEYKPMLSLAKVHSAEEVVKFANGEELIAMVKLDGLSCRLTYEDGNLVKAETRGDGDTGNLITEHAKQFKNIPLKIDRSGTYVIDGEAIITDEDFAAINDALPKGTEKYKNSRNLASGTLALLDTSIVKERKITFVAWDVIVGSGEKTIVKKLNEAESLGFDIVPYHFHRSQHAIILNEKDIDESNAIILNMAKDEGYLCDGVVWKFNNVYYGESLGKTEHHFNNGCAWKPALTSYPTKLIDVEWTMGKTGALCPTIITEPVEIDGTTVERASVHNVSIFKNFGFTKGCTCYLYKANLIIPQCDYVEDNNGELFEVPTKCPVCGAATEIKKDKDTEVLYCTSDSCKGKLLGKLTSFVGKNGMNIDGLSEATIELLTTKGFIASYRDIYHLKDHKVELSTLPRMAAKSVSKLLKSIEDSRVTTLDKFLTSLSIPLLGKSTCKNIAKACNGSFDNFRMIMDLEAENAFVGIDGFGKEMNTSLTSWWNDNKNMVYELVQELTIEVPEEKEYVISANKVDLNNATFCITGKLVHYANRDALVKEIESFNGKYVSSVSAKTNYLINNDKTSMSSKNKKALEVGCKIISEADFMQMCHIVDVVID